MNKPRKILRLKEIQIHACNVAAQTNNSCAANLDHRRIRSRRMLGLTLLLQKKKKKERNTIHIYQLKKILSKVIFAYWCD